MSYWDLKSSQVSTSYCPSSEGTIDAPRPVDVRLALPEKSEMNPLKSSECSFGVSCGSTPITRFFPKKYPAQLSLPILSKSVFQPRHPRSTIQPSWLWNLGWIQLHMLTSWSGPLAYRLGRIWIKSSSVFSLDTTAILLPPNPLVVCHGVSDTGSY